MLFNAHSELPQQTGFIATKCLSRLNKRNRDGFSTEIASTSHPARHQPLHWSTGLQNARSEGNINGAIPTGIWSEIGVCRRARLKTRKAQLGVIGPLRLANCEGQDCTPSGTIRKALLAILALSKDGVRSRIVLQTLLWETASSEQGAANLRTALSVLKKELRNGLGFDPIKADSQSVSLNLATFDVDVHQSTYNELSSPQILEGLQLRRTDCEEFEDWLRSIRRQWPEGLICPPPESLEITNTEFSIPVTQTPPESHKPKRGIGLLPVMVFPADEFLTNFGNTILDIIASDLTTLAQADIYDYRDDTINISSLEKNDAGPAIHIRLKLVVEKERFALHFYSFLASTQKMIASSSVTGEIADGFTQENDIVLGFITQNVDRILTWLENSEEAISAQPDTPYHILNTMFRFENEATEIANKLLEDALTHSQEPIYTGLFSYLHTFRVGEHWGLYDENVMAKTSELVNQTLEKNPLDGVTLTSAGHALGYTLQEYLLSGELLKKAVHLSPTVPFCWDHLALYYLYLGNYKEAEKAAKKAICLGAYSPFRFTYQTTLCMIYTLSGNPHKAIEYGKMVLSRRPNFGAALRYTTVCLSLTQSVQQSRQFASRLLELDPDFSIDWIDSGRWTLPNTDAKNTIKKGLVLAGIS